MKQDIGTITYKDAKDWIFDMIETNDTEAHVNILGLDKHE